MPAIVAAYEGRCDMLRAIFGGSDDDKPKRPDQIEAEQAAKAGSLFAQFDAMASRKARKKRR